MLEEVRIIEEAATDAAVDAIGITKKEQTMKGFKKGRVKGAIEVSPPKKTTLSVSTGTFSGIYEIPAIADNQIEGYNKERRETPEEENEEEMDIIIDREEAKKKILDLFKKYKDLDYGDIFERYQIDLLLIVDICAELEHEGLIAEAP